MKFVQCKNCGKKYKIKDGYEINQVHCSSCGGDLEDITEIFNNKSSEDDEFDIVQCENCGLEYKFKSGEPILNYNCKNCGGNLNYLDDYKNKQNDVLKNDSEPEVEKNKKEEYSQENKSENTNFLFKNFSLAKDKYYLGFLSIFSIILVAYYINFNYNFGVFCSDVYVYLINALQLSGTDVHASSTIHLSPLICFLTSLFFDLGFVDRIAIYIVTGAFAILGNIGFYILLKRYFNEIYSLTGTIILSGCTLYLTWLANGTLDIPATSLIIWFALFAITAINEKPSYYKYAIIILILGFFTRYTVALVVPAFLLYYIYEKGFTIKKEDTKHIIHAIGVGAISAVIILVAIMTLSGGEFGAGFQIVGGVSGQLGSQTDPSYNPNVLYYVENIANFISNSHTPITANPILENSTPLSWIVLAILTVGAGLWLYDNRPKFDKKYLIPAIIFLIAILSFTRISSFITTIIALIGLYLLGKDSDNKIGYFMLAWILSNLIFLSYYPVKVNRYLLPVFPPIIYFVLVGITSIQKHANIKEYYIPVLLIAFFIFQAFAFTATFEPTNQYTATEEMSNYIMEHNPDYKDVRIAAYNYRPYTWWLEKHVFAIGEDNINGIKDSKATYYISKNPMDNLTGFKEITVINRYHLYEKINSNTTAYK